LFSESKNLAQSPAQRKGYAYVVDVF